MATFVEVALQWARDLSNRAGKDVAILFQSNVPQCFAESGFQSGHHFSTAAVTLLQSNADPAGRWMALSYAPTSACIGMAALMGVKNMVWRHWFTGNKPLGLRLSGRSVEELTENQSINLLADKQRYVLPVLVPQMRRVLGTPGQLMSSAFLPPVGTADLIQQFQGADETAKNNACLLLAFAIASTGHGSLNNNPNRSAAYSGQNIASILVDGTYQIERWAINTNRAHNSLHGEINLVRSFQARNQNPLPNHGKLFTTLEPCIMCSGMIVHTAGAGNPFEVVSGQLDAQVGYSALKNDSRMDGYTGNPRSVTNSLSTTPIHPSQSFGGMLSDMQRRNTPPPGPGQQPRLMQTTVFLEEHAAPVMSDAEVMLDKMAAVWIPAAQRQAWRQARDKFLLHVKASIRG